ncbi:hypothetical protein JG687_00011350, partial [Phytophthora cactorum]
MVRAQETLRREKMAGTEDTSNSSAAEDQLVDGVSPRKARMPLLESIALQSQCYEAIDLQSVRMDDGPDDSLLVTTKCELTITETMLYCGFPNLIKYGKWSALVDKMLGKKIVIHGSTHSFWDHASGRVQRLHSELPLLEPDDAQSLLHDVLVFIDTCEDANASQTPLENNGERDKKRRLRYYSPDYERCRREKKKVEREALRSEVAQYEMQVELLRTQRLIHRDDSKWGWVQSATEEEEKRRKAEKLNHQLRGLLVQQFNIAQTLRNVLTQETGFAQ